MFHFSDDFVSTRVSSSRLVFQYYSLFRCCCSLFLSSYYVDGVVVFYTFTFLCYALLMIILIMSPPISPTSSRSQPSNSRDEAVLTARGQGRDELAERIEQQRAKIRALELAAEERRRSDELRMQEQAQIGKSVV